METKDKPEPGFWSQVHYPGQNFVSLFQKIDGIGQSCRFSPRNWLFSLFAGSDPWQNWGHSCMIAHSLDKTAQQVWKSRRMSTFCGELTNPSEWVLFFLSTLPWATSEQWKHGPLGEPGSQNECLGLVFKACFWRESREKVNACRYCLVNFPYRLNLLIKLGSAALKAILCGLFVTSQRWHLERNEYFQTKLRYLLVYR